VVEGHAELICEDRDAASAHENARLIIEQAHRMTEIIRQLLDFARSGRPSGPAADLGEVARGTVRMLEPIAKKRGVSIEVRTHGRACTRVPAAELQQVIANLAINGIQAMEEGGSLAIEVDRAEPSDDHRDAMIRLSVSDEGKGISEEMRGRIFEPFFTTKDVGEGTGLGLAVVHGIVHDRGGTIEVDSDEGRGSRFVILLPEEVAS
jgi:two-component system, NtrC family, sensor kinase